MGKIDIGMKSCMVGEIDCDSEYGCDCDCECECRMGYRIAWDGVGGYIQYVSGCLGRVRVRVRVRVPGLLVGGVV